MDFQKAFVFLFLGVLGLAASAADECTKALEGSSYTIALNSPKQEGDVLAWKHNDKNVVYLRRRGKTTGEGRVDDNGSLLLKNLTSAMSGTYRAEHHDRQGTLVKTITEKLCVIPKAPVPTLVVTCSSSGVGSLYCASGSSKGFTLSWFHNNVELKERVNPFTPTHPGEKDQYKCRLSNDLYLGDTQDSNDVIISCPRPDECTDKLEGSSHTIVLDLPEKSRGSLTWKCNDTTIYPSKKTARVQSTVNVDKKGSLSLAKLTTSMSGTYTAEYRVDKISATKTERLCVLPRAPVPKLSVKCSPVGEATLYCDPKPAAGFTLSWFSNNMELNDSSNPFQPRQHGEKHSYRCRLSNRLDKQDSNAVPVSCRGSGPSASDARQLCVSKRLVLVVLAGAALLFLVLTLALVIVSCKYCQQRNRKQVHEHVRLSSLRDTRADPPQWKQSPPGDQGYSHTPQGYSHTPQEDPSPAASQPGDQGYSHTPQEDPSPAASQPGAQPSPQPPAAAAAAEKPPHTPVPQPRKKLNLIPKANDSDTSANGQDCV